MATIEPILEFSPAICFRSGGKGGRQEKKTLPLAAIAATEPSLPPPFSLLSLLHMALKERGKGRFTLAFRHLKIFAFCPPLEKPLLREHFPLLKDRSTKYWAGSDQDHLVQHSVQ